MLSVLALIMAQPTVTCRTNSLGTTVCHQLPQARGGLPDFGAVMNSGRSMVPAYRPSPPQDESLTLRRRVGALVAAGKCAEAEITALKGGDMDLAARAKAYCDK